MRTTCVGFLLPILVFGCAQTEKSDRQAVQSIVNGIIEADNESNVDRVVNYYARGAVLMPPGKEPITGIDLIRKNYEDIFSSGKPELKIKIDEIKIADDLALCYGKTFGHVTVRSDSSVRNVNDKYIMMLRKIDRSWKITRLMWNSN